MKNEVNLLKMRTELNSPVDYRLLLNDTELHVNNLIGKSISLEWTGKIHCIKCGNKTNKSFAQGFCYPCFISAPETAPCIIKPELCEAHLGIARDMEWSKENCLTEHYVYLALSSNVKVGVTRSSQIPTRWIDQGAVKAIKLAKTPNRHLAGLIETDLKKHMSDKTSWQKMLKNEIDFSVDLNKEKSKASELLRSDLQKYLCDENEVYEILYPVKEYPQKVKSINLEKTPKFTGILNGIKGQYFIFKEGFVINIRKYGGYRIILEY